VFLQRLRLALGFRVEVALDSVDVLLVREETVALLRELVEDFFNCLLPPGFSGGLTHGLIVRERLGQFVQSAVH